LYLCVAADHHGGGSVEWKVGMKLSQLDDNLVVE
jgi:hypothetical protein